jgi:hypothetical protein
MRRCFLVIAFLASCGGSNMMTSATTEWTGSWRSAPSVPGSYVTMMLSGSGSSITGTGVQYVEAGQNRNFTVKGTSLPVPGPGVTFFYADGATEGFTFAQHDASHLVLSNPDRILDFTRG